MRRGQRLRTRDDFAAVYKRGRPYRNELLVLRALRTDGEVSRFGFTTGALEKKAVVRNRAKRRLREIARGLSVGPGWDIVINARRGVQEAEFGRLRSAVVELLGRAGALQEEEGR